jgi:sugar O-acyltransferase (sialic acid O-acetyltransferase NeuD family)
MPRDLVVIGGGEHARVVLDAAAAAPAEWRVLGFADPAPCARTAALSGVPRIGDDAAAFARVAAGAWVILGVGAIGPSDVRDTIARRYDGAGARWATLIHPRACVAVTVELAGGVFVAAGAIVNAGTRLGAHSVINSGAIVEHDCDIGRHVQLAPGAVVGGVVTVRDHAYLGLGCRVRDHVTIGAGVFVAMGAVVVGSVTDGVVSGVPARPRRRGDA